MENSFDGDRSTTGYAGDPRIRGFVPGEEDARDMRRREETVLSSLGLVREKKEDA